MLISIILFEEPYTFLMVRLLYRKGGCIRNRRFGGRNRDKRAEADIKPFHKQEEAAGLRSFGRGSSCNGTNDWERSFRRFA